MDVSTKLSDGHTWKENKRESTVSWFSLKTKVARLALVILSPETVLWALSFAQR